MVSISKAFWNSDRRFEKDNEKFIFFLHRSRFIQLIIMQKIVQILNLFFCPSVTTSSAYFLVCKMLFVAFHWFLQFRTAFFTPFCFFRISHTWIRRHCSLNGLIFFVISARVPSALASLYIFIHFFFSISFIFCIQFVFSVSHSFSLRWSLFHDQVNVIGRYYRKMWENWTKRKLFLFFFYHHTSPAI